MNANLDEGNPCPKCQKPLEMYYRPICFHCERPKPKTVQQINLILSLEWLERHGYEGIKDRVWSDLFEYYHFTNDSSFSVTLGPGYDYETGYQGVDEFHQALKELYNNGTYLVEVSW